MYFFYVSQIQFLPSFAKYRTGEAYRTPPDRIAVARKRKVQLEVKGKEDDMYMRDRGG